MLWVILMLWLLTSHYALPATGAAQREEAAEPNLGYLRNYRAKRDGSHRFVYSERPSVVGFWHVFAADVYDGLPLYVNVTREQKFVMESSGLLDELDVLYYVTIGDKGDSFHLPGSKLHHLHYAGKKGFELPTLHLLHRFCAMNPNSKVLYFHNKGSGYFSPVMTAKEIRGSIERKVNFRKALDCFTLNPRCIRALDSFDTCGMRFSAVPTPHFTGNYWWARCSYINQLIPPRAPLNNETFLRVTSRLNGKRRNATDFTFHNDHLLGFGRYFAETWVGSAPRVTAADCVNAAGSARDYVFGSGIPIRLRDPRTCPSWTSSFQHLLAHHSEASARSRRDVPLPRLRYGLRCGAADMLHRPQEFRASPQAHSMIRKYTHLAPALMKRSLLWYGQLPETYLRWLRDFLGDEPVIVSRHGGNVTVDQLLRDGSIRRQVRRIINETRIATTPR